MQKADFYTLFNYNTTNEILVKRKGWRYELDNGVVIFLKKDLLGWTSTEESTGNYIVANVETKKECLAQTVKLKEDILLALDYPFNVEKAKVMKLLIAKGKYETWN